MKTTIHNLALTFLCLFTMLVAKGQNPYTYDTSKLPDQIIGGGAGAKLTVPTPGVSNAQGFGFYAKQITPGLYSYTVASFQNGAITTASGAEGYLGTLFGKISLLGSVAPGLSFTPPTPTAQGAIGNLFSTGGDAFWGLHKFKNGHNLVMGVGGSRDFSNQQQVNSFNLRMQIALTL